MWGRPQFYRESATQLRVQRSGGLAHQALAIGYVLIPNGTFNLMAYPDYAPPHNRGWMSILLLETANHDNCHGQTTVSDRVRGSRGSGISGEITKMDFKEGSFPEGKSVT